MTVPNLARVLCSAVTVSLCIATNVAAQGAGWTWSDRAELSVVWTGGNASSNTLGIKNTLTGESGPSTFKVESGGIRTESSLKTRTASGTAGAFTVSETVLTQLTAESYFTRGQYNYGVTDNTYFFGGAGWNRNTFSGIDSRFGFVAGAGVLFSDTDQTTFRTDLGFTYTIQNPVAVGPTENFAGLRFTYDLTQVATETTTFESKLIVDENLKNTDDLRGDFINSLSVSISDRLALKTSLQLLFDNQPSLIDIPLFTGATPSGTVAAPLEKVDSVLTIALVINVM